MRPEVPRLFATSGEVISSSTIMSTYVHALQRGKDEWAAWKKANGNIEFTNKDLNSFSFAGLDLSGVKFTNCSMTRCNIKGANLDGAAFIGTDLNHANLEGVSAKNAIFQKSAMNSATLTGGDFSEAVFTDITLESPLADCKFVSAKWNNVALKLKLVERCSFDCAILEKVRCEAGTFRQSSFKKAILNTCNIPGCTLEDVTFTEVTLVECIFNNTTTKSRNEGASTGDFQKAVIKSTRFQDAVMHRTVFRGARFEEVDATGMKVDGADLSDTKCSSLNGSIIGTDINFAGAVLINCHLDRAELLNTNFKGAKLDKVTFTYGTLNGSSFAEVRLADCVFMNASLVGCDLRWVGLVNCDLRRANVNGMRVSRLDFEDMQVNNYNGLLKSQMYDLNVEDGFAQIRQYFGGFWAWYHSAATLMWLFPLFWLVARALVLSTMPDYAKSQFFASLGLWRQILGYIQSGDACPSHIAASPYWQYHWNYFFLSTFVLMLLYNVARLRLVLDVKMREHELAITGLHPRVEITKLRAFLMWVMKRGMIPYIAIAVYHAYEFLTTSYPVPFH